MTKYVVSAVYQEYGGRATCDIIGTFSTYKNGGSEKWSAFGDKFGEVEFYL